MEVLRHLVKYQKELEEALQIEIEPNEVNDTKEGKQLFRWLKKRHKAVVKLVKMFSEY